jgi:hypothetical protein
MAYQKSPRRTIRWASCCMLVEREVRRMECILDREKQYELRLQIIDYCKHQRAMATEQGYDDTATYMQHVLDDLTR